VPERSIVVKKSQRKDRCQTVILSNHTIRVFSVEPSGVQALKNPNPLRDVEASAVLDVAVLV